MSESKWTVYWERKYRPEDGILKCSGLTARIAFARLISGIENSGAIIVHKIERDNGQN